MKKLILSALVLATMASCTKTDTGPESGDNSNSITFGSSIDAATKVRDDAAIAFENGEAISVYGYRMDAAATTADFTANLFLTKSEFTFDGTKFSSADAAAIWQVGKAHNFYAYYPTTLTVTNNTTGATAPLTVVASTGIDAANDVMIANVSTPIYDGSKKSANLDFKHVLSKVRFKIKKELTTSMDAELTKVEFKMKSNAGTVNLATGAVTNTAGSVTMSKDVTFAIDNTAATEVPVNWMVLPVDEISDMILTIDGVQMKVTNANSTIATEAGKITSVIITVKSTGITFETSIDPWGDSEKVAGDLEPIIEPNMFYDSPNVDKTDMVGSTKISYNRRTGTVADGDNGSYQTTATAAYSAEKPFYKLEVALGDGAVTRASVSWSDARDMCLNLATDGGGWRLPRYSELRMMYNNRTNLESSTNFAEFDMATTYVSGTESDLSNVWVVDFATGEGINNGGRNNSSFNVRCVREIRLEAKIGYYVYSDNSISDEFALPSPMDYVVGLIYRVEKNNPKKVMIVTPFEYKQYWHGFNNKMISGATDTVSGLANRATIKALQVKNWFGASALCDTLNRDGVTGWCLPSKNELRALYAGYCGLRMIGKDGKGENLGDSQNEWGGLLYAEDSPEIPGTGEIPLWYRHPTRSMPGNDSYTAARAYFNAQLTAMGTHKDATPFREELSKYWSSSEYTGEEDKSANDNNDGNRKTELRTERAYGLNFITGAITSVMDYESYKYNNSLYVRCIKSVTLP